MSIIEKEELLRRSAQRWEDAAQEYKKAGEHMKAAEALRNAARNLEKAEEVHPIGYFNALARHAAEERAEKLRYDPREPRIEDN